MKRFYREKDRVRLQPANKDHKPIRTRDAHVLGRVVGVFRKSSDGASHTETRPRFTASALFDLKPLPSEREPTLAEVVELAWDLPGSRGTRSPARCATRRWTPTAAALRLATGIEARIGPEFGRPLVQLSFAEPCGREEVMPSRKVRTPQGKDGELSPPGETRGKVAQKQHGRWRGPRERAQAKVKRWGKSPPASRRRGGWPNPVRCKAKQDRRPGPVRSRWGAELR